MKVTKKFFRLSNGMTTVGIDYRQNSIRVQKRLKGIEFPTNPRTAAEREDVKAKHELVNKIIAKMQLDSLYSDFLIEDGFKLDKNFFEYAQEFMDRKAPVCEIRTYRAVTNSLKRFCGKEILPCGSITETMMLKFKDDLEARHNGVSAHNYFKKLKRMIKEATVAKHFKKNPTENIVNKKTKSAEKDTLTFNEVKLLVVTDCANQQVKRAFLFSSLTGLRFCDVKILKWGNIKNNCIDIVQVKTNDRLVIQLREDTLKLIGNPKAADDLVFDLPTHTGCLKHLKKWVKDAGITKHITWHCARHSFATNLVEQEVNPFTVSKLLGHKNITQTQTYLRVSDAKKLSAINTIPQIF